MFYPLKSWINIILGKQSNWEFFVEINGGWLEMEYQHRYGQYASEREQWEWMYLNAERIELSNEDYNELLKKLELD